MLAVVTTFPWLYALVVEIGFKTLKEKHEYDKKVVKWNESNPDLMRLKCKDCKYCISDTHYLGRYPNGYPKRVPQYCQLLKRGINSNSSCMLAEPPEGFYVEKTKEEAFPRADVKVYFSAYGNCYHSSPNCPSVRNSQNLRCTTTRPFDRRPCPKCWEERNGILCPKMKRLG